MNCQALQNNSTLWLPFINSPINNTAFCRSLPASIFDIEVLDHQNSQIHQFVGSAQGTTIQNLQPGTYTVNEIKHFDACSTINQLAVDTVAETACNSVSFLQGERLANKTAVTDDINYQICIEYEDVQNNDCSTLTLAAGEDKTCTVKNYIRLSITAN